MPAGRMDKTVSVAELRAQKTEREAAEKKKKAASEKAENMNARSNGRADIDAAHAALGTGAGEVPGVDGIDTGPQDVHDGDELQEPETPARSASGAPVQLGFTVGGKKPTGSQVRLVGGKIDVPGQYLKGQIVEFRVTVKFGELAFVDVEDKVTGQVIDCDRRQKGRIVSVCEVGA